MKSLIHLQTISDLYRLFDAGKPHHPLIAVLDFSGMGDHVGNQTKIITDFYSIMFKNNAHNSIRYGRKTVDFQDGNLICIAPNQVIEIDNEAENNENMSGWGLFFHPDLIRGIPLMDKMKDYNFFGYHISEALHLSEKEKENLHECVKKIDAEIKENIDVHSQHIIVATLELLLSYCRRYYGRQMITRSPVNKIIVAQTENILHEFFSIPSPEKGLPTVRYLAEKVHLSPGYLSDLLKKETGKNAQEHIHFYLIEEAKNILMSTDKSISEIAHLLGFEYPQYFNRLFKQKTGKTPLEFRNVN